MRGIRSIRKLAQLRPGAFGARIGFNGLAQIAPILATLIVTPVLVSRLGPDRFGVWSLALIALSTLTSLDGGVSASLSRFFAVHAARDDRADTGRLLLTAMIVFVVLGALVTVIAHWLAPVLVELVHVHSEHRHEAIWVFRWLPLLAVLAFASDAAAALLQGNGQFREFALVTCSRPGSSSWRSSSSFSLGLTCASSWRPRLFASARWRPSDSSWRGTAW